MTDTVTDMAELLFDLDVSTLPASYPFVLWDALSRAMPELSAESSVGILPFPVTDQNGILAMPRRTKLIMRLPERMIDRAANALTGKQFELDGHALRLNNAKTRRIQPHATLHAKIVADTQGEVDFMQHMHTQLASLDVPGKLICGRQRNLGQGAHLIRGYSLVVHDLTAEASLRLQCAGLGAHRHFGCGIFVPYKTITGLNEN